MLERVARDLAIQRQLTGRAVSHAFTECKVSYPPEARIHAERIEETGKGAL